MIISKRIFVPCFVIFLLQDGLAMTTFPKVYGDPFLLRPINSLIYPLAEMLQKRPNHRKRLLNLFRGESFQVTSSEKEAFAVVEKTVAARIPNSLPLVEFLGGLSPLTLSRVIRVFWDERRFTFELSNEALAELMALPDALSVLEKVVPTSEWSTRENLTFATARSLLRHNPEGISTYLNDALRFFRDSSLILLRMIFPTAVSALRIQSPDYCSTFLGVLKPFDQLDLLATVSTQLRIRIQLPQEKPFPSHSLKVLREYQEVMNFHFQKMSRIQEAVCAQYDRKHGRQKGSGAVAWQLVLENLEYIDAYLKQG